MIEKIEIQKVTKSKKNLSYQLFCKLLSNLSPVKSFDSFAVKKHVMY